ncbi:alpha/beta fold hydrolase [Bifidobacterium leontopitheci]|uniref:Lysophospholipase L2 n=1 Tax=Bifidobacterium leontopitheci TaxID=2650774 RepID=A0A6I1GCZ2_9BIFI|nr:alpha/beta fold hydrolase [Bifidobacterium leontopitheci]KAB7789520.1 lysophospholipase L2 [Bifidobacterium leontopitheci]
MQVPLIDESRYDEEMSRKVLPALAQCRTEGWMEPAEADGLAAPATPGKLHYVCYDAAKFDDLDEVGASATFRGAIVISHGFTEFAAKYSEMVWYFLLAGYSVCVFEHRGHGYSVRDVDNPSLVWIDDWHRYVADLAKFADTIGKEYADGMPLNLFCHSMGGGIGAGVLETRPTLFDKAVLSCPMIAPATAGLPNWLAGAVANVLCSVGLSRHIVFGQSEFTPELDMADHPGASEARVRWFQQQRIDDPHQQTYAATFEWLRQALRMSRAIQKPAACGEIETPILLFQAGRDVWVLNEPQNRFVREVNADGGDARLVRVSDSLHEIFSMPNVILGPYLAKILTFFGSDEMAAL